MTTTTNALAMAMANDWVTAFARRAPLKPSRSVSGWLSPWLPVWKEEGTAVSRVIVHPALDVSSTHLSVITYAMAEFCSPRAELGRRLRALREAAIAEGMPLLTWDQVLEEVKRRRGETVDDEQAHLP